MEFMLSEPHRHRINPIVYTVIGCGEANVMPRTRQIDGSTYGINVIVIPQMLKSSFDSGLWYSHIH